MPTYSSVDDEVIDLVDRVMESQFPVLDTLEPEIDLKILFAYPTGNGHAITKNGWPCLGLIKVVSTRDRAAGGPDVLLLIDGDRWPRLSPRRREALIAHELYHLEPQYRWDPDRKINVAVLDDLKRPIVKIRKHDFELGGFEEIVARYGRDSVEQATLDAIIEKLFQKTMPFMAVPPAEAPSIESAVDQAMKLLADGRFEEAMALMERSETAVATKLVDAMEARKKASEAAKEVREELKVDRWQDVSLAEILPDNCDGGAIIDQVALCLELADDQCPTVGDLALIWFSEREKLCTLEAMTSLSDDEREILRNALIGFRESRGWPPRIGLPDGIPLAWLNPEPTADIVIDPMAAAKRDDDQVDVEEETPDGGHLEWTSADLERELEAACKIRGVPSADGKSTVWPFEELKRTGCDDGKILEVLRAIWPGGYEAIQGNGPWKKRLGCTVHGGSTPAIWIGARKSTDRKLAPPTLEGLRLADRVRTVLGIPRAPVPDAVEEQEDPKPKKAVRRKAVKA